MRNENAIFYLIKDGIFTTPFFVYRTRHYLNNPSSCLHPLAAQQPLFFLTLGDYRRKFAAFEEKYGESL
jgi:hypothetical protein